MNLVDNIKNYFIDTTGLVVASSPIYAAMETFGAEIQVKDAIEARVKATVLAYLGLGKAYAWGRDKSKKIFKINNKSNLVNRIYDSLYNAGFNALIAGSVYSSSGANLEETISGTLGAIGLGLITGPLNGKGIDTFRTLLKEKKGLGKKTLASLLIISSLLTCAGIYETKNYIDNRNIKIEQTNY